jgi:peptidoglycan/xylan/chitin deacetylase (PgdA/CDA1 family)
MVFPGFEGDPSDPIVSFLVDSREALAPTGTLTGVSVFGIAVTRPDEIAQDVSRMAPEVDYIAPMVYPSHWGTGEYGLSSPESQPYEIVAASLADYERAVRGTGARVVPWLQDFSLGVEYGPAEVRAQIDAARDVGIDEWLLWDPAVTYTTAALDSKAKLPTTGLKPPTVEGIKGPKKSSATGTGPVTDLAVNELGAVPVLMYHQILPDGGSEYDMTPKEFRKELQRLYDEGYRPITAADLVNGTIDVPKGTTPVVLTFDDGSASQIGLTADGEIDPNTAVGIMLEFAESHPGFVPAGTFYVNADPFAAGGQTGQVLHWLADHGFEVANHTQDHANLSELSDEDVQRQFVLGNRVIHDSLPKAKVVTMALPFGVMPSDESLMVSGSWDGEDYRFEGVMLVGAEPAPSPFSEAFDGAGIPRIRSDVDPDVEYGSWFWLDRLARDPGLRFISDGDPDTVSFPQDRESELAEAFEQRARPY